MAGLPPPGSDVAAILRAQPRPQNWTALEVRRWLEAIELDVYAPIFEAAGVQGADLVSMDADALKRRLGVSHIGHRSKLLKEISILANRAMLSMRRGEEGKTKDFAEKRKDLLDTLYPDRVRRELQAQQHEKLLEARASFWTPDNRKTMGAVEKSAVVNQSKAGGEGRTGVAPHRKHAEDNIVITEGLARPNVRLEDDQHRTRWIAHPAQQRAVVRPATGGRQRAPRGGAARPQTAGAGRAADREETYGMVHENDGEVTTDEAENFITPKQKMQDVAERIKALEASGNYPELIKAWVEYGACVRMEHSDKDKLLVRTHFNLATTYLRQKLVLQALYHFKEADLVNQSNATSDDAISFRCRIMEGMGICETRLGHFKAADALLEQARRLCLKKALSKAFEDDCKKNGADYEDDEALTRFLDTADVEEISDTDGAVASVLVAKSELCSAQAEYDTAVQCLEQAYTLKEAQLGGHDPQIGKLYSAIGTIRQKQMRHKLELLQDVQATLDSAIRIRQEIQDKTEGLVLKGLEQEKGLEQLLRDIANMQDKESKLKSEVRTCKADVLDFMNRTRKNSVHNRGEGHEETVKLTKLVANLAAKFAEEEAAQATRTGALDASALDESTSPTQSKRAYRQAMRDGTEKTKAFLAKQGIDVAEWGLDGAGSPAQASHDNTEALISILRSKK